MRKRCLMLILFKFVILIPDSIGDCSVNTPGVYTFGPECQYMCHCKNGASCDTDTGECRDGCDNNWVGPACQYRDFAENQVSRHNSNKKPPRWASEANDGDTSTCSYTAEAQYSKTNPWWRVWFPQNETIRVIYIRTTNTKLEYFPGFEVTVEYVPKNQNTNNTYVPTYKHTCYQHDNTEPGSIDIHVQCEQVFVGNQVRITLSKVKSQLVLCDVRIGADCLLNTCGYECKEECHCKGLETLENKINGICSTGCDGRWTGINDSCNTECANNKWGEACSNECGACKDSTCDVKTGICPNGCQIGYYETDMCTQACDNGTWGLKCNKTCGNCSHGVCNPADGSCESGCASGYKTTLLCTEECDNKTYGTNCSSHCSTHCEDICTKVNGSCTCLPGWTGDSCKMACGKGTWGYYCNNTCGNCSVDACNASDGVCEFGCASGYKDTPLCIEECDDGTYGSNCSGICSIHCPDACSKEDGTCVQCDPGWTGELCQEACRSGFYRHKCEQACSVNCDEQLCHYVNGSCTNGCTAGWQECENGMYGFECNYTCNIHCQETCNKIDGQCTKCEVGWNGTLCDKECENGTYGDGCSFICGKCMDNASCHKMTGSCAVGCNKGYKGSLCTTRTEPSTETGVPSAAVGGGVSAVVVLALVVVGVIFFWRRKQLSSKAKQSTSNLHDIGLNDVCSTEEETDGTLSIKKSVRQNEYYEFEGDITRGSQLRAIVLKELAEFVKTRLAQKGFFDKEFQDIPYGLQFPTTEARKEHNAGKNRYREMYAYDHTRVVLSTLPTNPHSDYINASYIKGYQKERAYIASQGPTDANIEDFWRMIWEEDVQLIAMVTNLVENTKMKCIPYWVSVESSKLYGDITVFTESEESFAEFDIRRFRLSKQGESIQRNVVHYAYTAWPDKDVPSSTCSLLHFWNKFRKNDENKTHPWLIHCSAGVGRTGTFIALDILYDQGKDAGYIDINMCVRKLREQRVNMVQKAAQYAYLYRIMVEALVLPSQPVALSQFDPWYDEQLGFDKKTGKTKLMLEFESMVDDNIFVTSTDEKADKDDPCVYQNTQADHKNRNRYSNIIAADGFRPFLSTYVAGTNNYINAVYIPSYNDLHGYLVTQTPLPDTAVDCCRLVIEQEIHVIVTFDDDGDNTVGVYLPSNGSIEIGPFKVTLTSTKEEDGYLIRKYIMVYKSKEHTVIQFIYKKWSADKLVPEDTYHVLEFLHKVDKQDRQFDNKPTLVQCLNGAERSCLFVVLMHVIERARIDEEVSIPQVIRYLRTRRQQIVPNYEQYKFCHELILCYAESKSTYANM